MLNGPSPTIAPPSDAKICGEYWKGCKESQGKFGGSFPLIRAAIRQLSLGNATRGARPCKMAKQLAIRSLETARFVNPSSFLPLSVSFF